MGDQIKTHRSDGVNATSPEHVDSGAIHWERLVDSLGTALVVFGVDGLICKVNAAFEKWAGVERAEIEHGRRLLDFIAFTDHGKVEQAVRLFFQEHQEHARVVECDFISDAGHKWPVEVIWSAIEGSDDRLALFHDLSRFKGAQETSDYENMLYSISHNLKSPIVSVKGFASLLRSEFEQLPPDQCDHYLERIEKNAARMERMIHDIFQYSKLASREQRMREISLQEVVQNVCADYQFEIKKRGIVVDIPTPLPALYADAEDMRTVFANLLDNAVKYLGEQPTPRIEVGWEDKSRFYVFWVRDNGMGVPEDLQERMFELFQRGVAPGQIEGSGVGLAIVKRVVEKYGGTVRLSSEIGQGTTVYFAIPTARL